MNRGLRIMNWLMAVVLMSGIAVAEEDTPEKAKAAPPMNWDAAPVDIVLQAYAESLDKIILKDPGVPNATISLKARDGQTLTMEEYLEAIEVVLEMNGVHVEPYGDKFIRAIPRSKARKEGIPLILDNETKLTDTGKVVSMMITFNYIAVAEGQKLLEGLKSDSGQLLVFERTNSILVTDTEQNINRMLEITATVDKATPVTEEVFVRQIRFAAVDDIKQIIQNIVQESQKEQEKDNKGAAATQNNRATPSSTGRSLLSKNKEAPAPTPSNESLIMNISDADRGMIRGKVIIMSDTRANKLVVITSRANMNFFDKIIEEIDIETTPEVEVKVVRLKYADSEDVADMINDLIGNSASSKNSTKNQNQNSKNGTGGNKTQGSVQPAKAPANQRSGESKAGELNKDNVTVLSDERINGLVIMARKEDMPTVLKIVEEMDVKLSQVLIETVIIEVGLGDNINTGIDWVRGINKNKDKQYSQALGGGGGDTDTSVLVSAATNAAIAAASSDVIGSLPAFFTPGTPGLSYAVASRSLDMAAYITASKTDNRAKYIASPVIMTVDNKEAKIEATESRKFFSGSTSSGYSTGNNNVSYNYSDKDVGITITVTPKINPNGMVMLEVEEEYSQLGAGQQMLVASGNGTPASQTVDTALTRKMSADVILENGQTVVLGGLTEKSVSENDSGIPILKDIPWIGKYLFGKTEYTESRKELLVFMTPYVLKDGDEAEKEAQRRKSALSTARPWEDNGWSKSKLADPVSSKELLRRQKEEWKEQDENHSSERELEKARDERIEFLMKRLEQEAEEDKEAKEAKEDAKS